MNSFKLLASAVAMTLVAGSASAATIYADSVVSYTQGAVKSGSFNRNDDPNDALGAPDYVPGSGYVSLGVGGSLTVEFTNYVFTGSGDGADDLFVYEIGALSEGSFVEVSANGVDFYSVGSTGIGNIYGVDLDAFGFGVNDAFSFVRITDDSVDGFNNLTPGADIDSVSAFNTTLTAVPLPAAGWLLLGAFGGLAAVKRRKS